MYDKNTMEHLGLMVMRRCNYELSRVMGMRRWLTVMNATVDDGDSAVNVAQRDGLSSGS